MNQQQQQDVQPQKQFCSGSNKSGCWRLHRSDGRRWFSCTLDHPCTTIPLLKATTTPSSSLLHLPSAPEQALRALLPAAATTGAGLPTARWPTSAPLTAPRSTVARPSSPRSSLSSRGSSCCRPGTSTPPGAQQGRGRRPFWAGEGCPRGGGLPIEVADPPGGEAGGGEKGVVQESSCGLAAAPSRTTLPRAAH